MAPRCSSFLLLTVLLVAMPEVQSAGFLRVRSVPSNLTQAVTSTDDVKTVTIDESVDSEFEGQLIGQVDAVEEDAEAAEGASEASIAQTKDIASDDEDKPAPVHHDVAVPKKVVQPPAPEAPKKAVQPPAPKAPKKAVQPPAPKKVVQPTVSHEKKAPPAKLSAFPTKPTAPKKKPRGTYNYITGKFQPAASLVQVDEDKFVETLIQVGKKDADDSEDLEDSDEDDTNEESDGDDAQQEANDETEDDEDESSQDEEGTADEEEQTEDESSQDSEEGQTDEAQEEDSDEDTDEDNQAEEDTEEQTSEGDDEEDAAVEDNGESDGNGEEESSEDDDEDN